MSKLFCSQNSAGYEACGDAPGLPKVPSAEKIDVDENSKITGLF